MTTFEPRRPKSGWLCRWFKQGAELVLRALPVLLPMTIIGNVALMVVIVITMRLVPGIETAALPSFLAMPMFYLYTFAVYHAVMRADGRRAPDALFSKRSLTTLLPPLLLALGAMGTIFAVAAWTPTPPFVENAVPSFEEGTGAVFRAVVINGLLFVIGNVMVIAILGMAGPFWQALQVGMGIGLGTFFLRVLPLMIVRMPVLSAGISTGSVVVATGLIFLPFWLGQIGALLLMAWMYVGAREIFGGIADNGEYRSIWSAMLSGGHRQAAAEGAR